MSIFWVFLLHMTIVHHQKARDFYVLHTGKDTLFLWGWGGDCKCTPKKWENKDFAQNFALCAPLMTHMYASTRQVHSPLICSSFAIGATYHKTESSKQGTPKHTYIYHLHLFFSLRHAVLYLLRYACITYSNHEQKGIIVD